MKKARSLMTTPQAVESAAMAIGRTSQLRPQDGWPQAD
jgi:hypothetical protein